MARIISLRLNRGRDRPPPPAFRFAMSRLLVLQHAIATAAAISGAKLAHPILARQLERSSSSIAEVVRDFNTKLGVELTVFGEPASPGVGCSWASPPSGSSGWRSSSPVTRRPEPFFPA